MRTNTFSKLLSGIIIAASFAGCSSDDPVIDDNSNNNENNDNNVVPETEQVYYNILTRIDGTRYIQAHADLTQGSFGPKVGQELTISPTTCASHDGKTLYMFGYGKGTMSKYILREAPDFYTEEKRLDALPAIGYAWARFRGINEETASLHNMSKEMTGSTPDDFKIVSTAKIMMMDLTNFSLPSKAVEAVVPTDNKALFVDQFIEADQLDFPAIIGNKIYYGLRIMKRDPQDPTKRLKNWDRYEDCVASTLVLDYPSLTNPKIVTHKEGRGSTAGEHCPLIHVYDGAAYQVSNGGLMMRLKDGDYDNSFDFNIKNAVVAQDPDAAGREFNLRGWFHVGDGIGYCLYDLDEEFMDGDKKKTISKGGVARIDLKDKSLVVMNIKEDLKDSYYTQSAKLVDGKLYMARTNLANTGFIYIFDTKSTSPDGFTKGGTLEAVGGEASYYGIF